MSDTLTSLQRKIGSAADLQAVVRTMKAMAAANITQYERAVVALSDYYRAVQLGLRVCLRQAATAAVGGQRQDPGAVAAIVFGSDQGLVGQFNETMADFAVATLADVAGNKRLWAVGERVRSRLEEAGLAPERSFALPGSISAITPLLGEILVAIEARRESGQLGRVYLFHQQPCARAIYAPACQRLLPLDDDWRREIVALSWPGNNLPEAIGDAEGTLLAFVREYLFVSLFRVCAESLASENASRLAAMQRAEKNIEELLDDMHTSFQRLRQSGIDEELFDVVSGFEALSEGKPTR